MRSERRATTARIAIDVRTAQGGYPGIGRATEHMVLALLARDTRHQFRLVYHTYAPLPASLRAACRAPHALLPIGARLRGAADQVELPLRLRQARIELYHATYYAAALAPGCPYVLNVFDLIPERYPQYWSRAQSLIIRRWLRRATRGARRIIVPSHATARDLEARYHLPATRIVYAPLAVGRHLEPAKACSAPGATPPRSYVLCVCTNKPHKNLTRLVRAYDLARREQPRMPELIVAGGWDVRYPEPRALAVALGLDAEQGGGGGVYFVANPSDAALDDLYRGALGFIFPSEYEGFGLPVLEAMAAGLPVAASRTPAVAEVADDAALSFDPLDEREIARALHELVAGGDTRRRLIAAGQARLAAFSWEATAAATIAAYDAALTAPIVDSRGRE